ncbi:unnamed protein product [Rotaria magnacalcarata]|uniref:Uncharacterized protein n=2 Tax=Rotaria magnacalcarata TaxID=392030 RepID=A0A816SU63_9BILA|nr:unnamed protein product [Rotaria magnacalcarata]CAF2092381.1 unnamed protein product [Rotaria magnacalcarata]CAF2191642.1 unnamed protein product [Rotaria magnacalcarata]CAF3730855.1 unnamed protein product [Rotaria magnacalcarata]CAF3775616.1 unnamed protein product [Rotaria magnacalcarata]
MYEVARFEMIRMEMFKFMFISYMQYPNEVESNRAHHHQLNLSQGQTNQVEFRLVKLDGYEAYAPIETIEVTLADGQQVTVKEPFDGVHQIENDWLFVIDNTSIRSVGNSN